MQSPEPATGPIAPSIVPAHVPSGVAPPPTPLPPGRRKGPRSRTARLWLALVLGVMMLLCLGGVGVVISFYDQATAIKRTAPDAVVDNFLGAYLVSRDDSSAELYECKTGGSFAALKAFRDDITSRERTHSVGIRVTWSSLTVATSGAQGTVTTDLTKATDDGEHITKPWLFTVVDQDGWRVCGATEVS